MNRQSSAYRFPMVILAALLCRVAWADALTSPCVDSAGAGSRMARGADAGFFNAQHRFATEDTAAEDQFGLSVAVSADIAVVGAPFHVGGGAVYVYGRHVGGIDGWGLVRAFSGSDTDDGDAFGKAVAVHGTRLIVGAPGDSDDLLNAGSAYIFERHHSGPDSWGEVLKLTPSEASPFAGFGTAVDIRGQRAVVGASKAPDGGSGRVFVFELTQRWSETAQLQGEDTDEGFGSALALEEDVLLVGAPNNDEITQGDGAAYVLIPDDAADSGWGVIRKLIPTKKGDAGERFGLTVDIAGDTAVVGADQHPELGFGAGAAYIFQRDQDGSDAWGQVIKLTASDGSAFQRFGGAVGISADMVIVGAPLDNAAGALAGAAYVFGRDAGGVDAWGELDKFVAADTATDDGFGFPVAISGDAVVLGAVKRDDFGHDSGAAYVFYMACTEPPEADDLNSNGVPDSCEACTAVAACADLDGDGIRDATCTAWACEDGRCSGVAVVYADMGGLQGDCTPDGAADGNDRFHALNCFANISTFGEPVYPCEPTSPQALNVDVAGLAAPCVPDGVCDGNDAFAAINAFEAITTCSCPSRPAPIVPATRPVSRRK